MPASWARTRTDQSKVQSGAPSGGFGLLGPEGATSLPRGYAATARHLKAATLSNAPLVPPPLRTDVKLSDLQTVAVLGEGAFGLVKLVRLKSSPTTPV